MKNLEADIKANSYKKAYLLCGDEGYLVDMYKNKLKGAILPPDDTMNLNTFEGKQTEVASIAIAAQTLPFFSDRRLIICENTGFFKNANDEICDYLDNLQDTAITIFVEDEIDKRTKAYKKLKECGYICEMNKQTEVQLINWVARILNNDNKKITKEVAQVLLGYTGNDMINIANEVNKLISYVGTRPVIQIEDIEQICTAQINGRIFDMIDAMGVKDKKRTLNLYYDLVATKEPPMRILFMLARQFNQMLIIQDLDKRRIPREEISKKTGTQTFIINKCLKQLSNFSQTTLKEALNECVSIEEDIKNGRLADSVGVELLLIKYSTK